MKELEKLIAQNHSNYAKISQQYKLFEYVTSENREQVLRYCWDNEMAPLWPSEQNRLDKKDVPKCARCGSQRIFEFQIMPQLFDYLEELRLVDWETIVVYTCANTKCMPEKESFEI